MPKLIDSEAEHRGPGNHHGFDDNHDDYDMPMDLDSHRAQTLSRLARGVILLPDGSGFATGSGFGNHTLQSSSSDDAEMFDNDDEDKDLESQINKGTPSATSSENDTTSSDDRTRREETPAPTSEIPATLPSRSHNDSETKKEGTVESTPATKTVTKSVESTKSG